MAKIAKQLTELIGNTPLLELTKFSAYTVADNPPTPATPAYVNKRK